MNIKRFSKIIFNIVIITITLFITTNIVNAENTISTSIDKQINITQSTKTAITKSTNLTKSVKPQSEGTINNDIKTSTNEDKQENSTQQKQEQTTITQSTKEKAISTQAQKKKNYQYVRFFINYKSEALDAGESVGGQDPDKFTPMLWECDVKNATADTNYYIVGETKDNSYKADKEIRKLVGDKKDGSIYLVSFPTDEYIFKELKQYVNILSIDGKSIKVDELNTDHYEVRWYVFKLHSNFWHIDGKLVRKEGQIIVTKTFKGNKDVIEELTGYSFEQNKSISKSPFNITLKGGTDIKILNLF